MEQFGYRYCSLDVSLTARHVDCTKLFEWLFENWKSQIVRNVILCIEVGQSGFERWKGVLISL